MLSWKRSGHLCPENRRRNQQEFVWVGEV